MSDELNTLLFRTGLNPDLFTIRGFAPATEDEPAVAVGRFGTSYAVVRADVPGSSVAILSADPQPAMNHLTEVERERLRGEALTPNGASAPVGQEAAARAARTDIPYAPPLPTVEPPPIEADTITVDPRDVTEVAEAPCGNPACVVIEGQELHAPDCPARDDA